MKTTILATALLLAAFGGGAAVWAAPPAPAAVYQDPPVDRDHPASGGGVQFDSHGALVNAQLYRPAGAGAHPTVVLLHGLPGNEQNLDLARAIQRAGWTVITFHYRGSWGSGGVFTLKGGGEDAEALLGQLRQPGRAAAWGVDPKRIVIIGHSYGGFVAARTAAGAPDLMGVGLIAPWDVSFDARAWSGKSDAEVQAIAVKAFDDVDGRLTGATGSSLARDIVRDGQSLDLTKLAPALETRPLLILTATRDDPDDQAAGLLEAVEKSGDSKLTSELMDTDHSFNDHRIALETAVLGWLAGLAGAPR